LKCGKIIKLAKLPKEHKIKKPLNIYQKSFPSTIFTV